jgi:hypothetical protein
MDEIETKALLLRRLGRIERLRVSSTAAVLGELRLLVPEAEACARAAAAPRARASAAKLEEEVGGMR